MGLNLTDEQKRLLVQAVLSAVVSLVVTIAGIIGYNIIIVQPQLAALSAALAVERVAPEIGAQAVTYNVSTNPVRVKAANIDAFTAWNGSDIKLYSDGGSTLKFGVDGATGNTTNAGTLAVTGAQTNTASLKVGTFWKLNPASTVAVTQGGTITPLGSYQPITSTAGITATTVATSGFAQGDVVFLVNNNASNTIVLTNSSSLILPGGDLTLGANDGVWLLNIGSNKWQAMASVNN